MTALDGDHVRRIVGAWIILGVGFVPWLPLILTSFASTAGSPTARPRGSPPPEEPARQHQHAA